MSPNSLFDFFGRWGVDVVVLEVFVVTVALLDVLDWNPYRIISAPITPIAIITAPTITPINTLLGFNFIGTSYTTFGTYDGSSSEETLGIYFILLRKTTSRQETKPKNEKDPSRGSFSFRKAYFGPSSEERREIAVIIAQNLG